ncbi:MAG: Gfo/Idh/MocA family oxidoreductase [Pseudomonadota bacterium]
MKAALFGLGMVAETHVRALADAAPAVSLAGICARDPAKAAAYAEKVAPILGAAPHVYSDVASVASDAEVDFTIICTPPNARADLVAPLAQAGKAILMEKPLERDFAAARQIIETCDAANVAHGVVFQHRMRESSQRLAKMLAEGALGDLAVAEIVVPWWREQSYYDEPGRGTYARDGGGVLISQAIHTLDLALSLLGPVTRVQAMARTSALHKMEAEDFVTAGLEFESGMIGSLVASTASHPGGAESITLHGSKASVVLVSGQLNMTWRDGRTETIGEAGGTGGGADPMAFTHAWHQAVITDFAEALQTGRKPAADGHSALIVHQLIDAIIESSNAGHAVTLPRAA